MQIIRNRRSFLTGLSAIGAAGLLGSDKSLAASEPPPDLMATVRALRGRWQSEIAARGVDRDRALALDERFAKAFAKRSIERAPFSCKNDGSPAEIRII